MKVPLLDLIRKQPLPEYEGREPSELDLHRITKLFRENRLDEVPDEHQRWLCYRLIPCLMKYGVYPPPGEQVCESHTKEEHDLTGGVL